MKHLEFIKETIAEVIAIQTNDPLCKKLIDEFLEQRHDTIQEWLQLNNPGAHEFVILGFTVIMWLEQHPDSLNLKYHSGEQP